MTVEQEPEEAEEQVSVVPTLEDLLAARGIHKSAAFDDYQDYIEERQASGVKARLMTCRASTLKGACAWLSGASRA